MTERLIVRNGFVLTMDDTVGDILGGDVLIEDGLIAEVGLDLSAGDADVIDATNCVVIPGFIDTHRHLWETVVRGVLPSCTLEAYFGTMLAGVAPVFRPEDVHAGGLVGALEALNAGITTIVDWSHCTTTPDHADAAVSALSEAGIRAVYAYGPPAGLEWWMQSDRPHPDDARRVRQQYFASDDQLLTFALAIRGPFMTTPETTRRDWEFARELGARITMHTGFRMAGGIVSSIRALADMGLLGPDTTYVHCCESGDDELKLIADSGGTVSVSPFVELLMGIGLPPIGRLLAHGLRPALSVDVVASAPGDLFTQMRTALAYERIQSFSDDLQAAFAPTLDHRDVLRFATIDGASACGLAHKVGSLSPGKDADVVVIRADQINTLPLVDPAAVVVTSADTANVDTVLVKGRPRKRRGALVDVDLRRLQSLAERSRDYVLHSAGLMPRGPAARPSQEEI